MLVKIASSRQPVPSGIFASDQYKPSIRYEESERAGDKPPASNSGACKLPTLSSLEVMELDGELGTEPDVDTH
jgi:hypothetical protein